MDQNGLMSTMGSSPPRLSSRSWHRDPCPPEGLKITHPNARTSSPNVNLLTTNPPVLPTILSSPFLAAKDGLAHRLVESSNYRQRESKSDINANEGRSGLQCSRKSAFVRLCECMKVATGWSTLVGYTFGHLPSLERGICGWS